jgi:protein-L-isoaspartate(D-aspartate) O-methyltransferase
MVDVPIALRGDPQVLDAMRAVPGEALSSRVRRVAYEDGPLPIGEEQTISQPTSSR